MTKKCMLADTFSANVHLLKAPIAAISEKNDQFTIFILLAKILASFQTKRFLKCSYSTKYILLYLVFGKYMYMEPRKKLVQHWAIYHNFHGFKLSKKI